MKEPSLSNKKTQGLFGTYPHFYLPLHRFQNESTSGKVLEWLKRHAWKACNRQNWFAGSNPVLSAPDFQKEDSQRVFLFLYGTWRAGDWRDNRSSNCVYIHIKKVCKKLCKTYTEPYTIHYINLIIWMLRSVGFVYQTLHKPYTETDTNPTLKPTKPYTETGTETCKTLHKNYTRKPTPQPYILFFEHESNEWNEWTRMNRA